MKPMVYVTRRLPPPGLELVGEHCRIVLHEDEAPPSREALLAGVAGADGLICLPTDRIDAAVMDAGGSLRVISTFSVGFEHIDVAEATRRGICVGYTPGVLTEATADLAFALLIGAARRLAEADRFVRAGRWTTPLYPLLLLGLSLGGKTLGIVGLGRIGRALATRAAGFGLRLLYCDTVRLPAGEEQALGVEYRDLDRLLAESDFVSIHTPLTAATRALIGERELRLMKKDAILVNTSRGPVVDQGSLVRALTEGWIRAAGIDVYEQEPVCGDNPLAALDNVTLIPHLGSATTEARSMMAEIAARNLLNVLIEGKPPVHWLNPEAGKR